MKVFINVRFSLFGTHRWPNPVFKEVEFLSASHTHTFKFRLMFKVEHNDRDKEFFMEKDKIIKYLQCRYANTKGLGSVLDFEGKSCEHLACELLETFDALEVEVQEDDLDSAIARAE